MSRNEEVTKFAKLSKVEKGKLTLSWLSDLVKNKQLNIADVMYILNSYETTFSNLDKFNTMLELAHITASTISKMFGFGYAKSMRVINLLIKEQAIVKDENKYKIIDKEKFKEVGKLLFEKDDK